MNKLTSFPLLIALLLALPTALHAAELTNLRCEYRENPLGIDALKPRLSWIIEDRGEKTAVRGQKQTAYQVLAASTPQLLANDQGDLWDSGKVVSDQSIQVEYAGKPLASRTVCYWKVRVWDRDGKESAWSPPALWTMGLLKPEDWQARWIGADTPGDPDNLLKPARWIWFPAGDPAVNAPAGICYFRRVITVPADRKVVKATVRMTADNSFELYVNGKKAGQGEPWMTPVTMDVSGLLQAGPNVVAVAAKNSAPGAAGLIASLRVEFAAGEPLVTCTDAQWKTTRLLEEGWEREGFDDARWAEAKSLGAYGMAPWGNAGTAETVPAARYLRREFLVAKKIVRATAYVCGLGFFDCAINGQPVGDHLMDPAFTSYPKRAMYVTFDVTRHLRQGTNAIALVLGPGRYAQHFKGRPCLLLQLEMVLEDGTTQQLVTDETWKGNADGPIRSSDEYHGEEYDARKEFTHWDSPGFDDSRWPAASLLPAPCANLQAQMLEPMRVTEVIKPISINSPAPGVYIVDMGQNFYGMVRLKVSGPAGATVRMVSSYSLRPDGTLKTEDNRGARCTDLYTLKGGGPESWSPRFKGQGFRRVQVTGFPGTPVRENFEGLAVHSDVQPAGAFACSSALINRIHQNIRWGQRMYKRSVPLDPDRDERQGWLGDPAKDAESDAFNFNVASFYAKWLADIRIDQAGDGNLSSISPVAWPHYEADLVWPSVMTILPDWLHDFYGDRRVLEENYSAMKRWLDFQCRANQKADFTVDRNAYGDWCDVSTIGIDGWGDGTKGKTSKPLISTAYHYHNIRIMARAAGLLGETDDVRHYETLARQVGDAFNRRFFNPASATYESGTQCAYVLALMFDLAPPEHRARVIQNLADDILVKNKGHLSVGLVGMQWLMQALDKIGRNDLAYTIVTQTDRPSWGYMISKGATTIWERWDTDTLGSGMNSEALLILSGNLDAWFYQALAGINYDPEKPGFKHIIIRPQPLGDLRWVKAHHDSPYGRIVSHWKRDGNKLAMDVTIPANSTATVYVPSKDEAGVTEGGNTLDKVQGVKFLRMQDNAVVYAVGSGTYRFQSTLKETNK